MARLAFPDEGSRLVYNPTTGALAPPGTKVYLYLDLAATQPALDLLDGAGAANTTGYVTTDVYRRISDFSGPDGLVDVLYAVVNGGPVTPVYASETVRIDGLAARVTVLEADSPATAVQSVNGHSGTAVTVTKSDVGLGSADNTADTAKPVSTAQAAADAATLTSANTHADAGAATNAANITANATAITAETTRATAAEAAAIAASSPRLTRTAVKTGAYTAVAGDLVPCDTTSAAFTVTLPNAPAVGSRVAVKLVTLGAGHAVTIACAGSDVFNKAGGSTSGTLTLLNQALQVQYDTGGIWTVVADDLPKSALDGAYAPLRKPVLYNPTHLRRFAAKRNNALNQLVNIACVGDSMTVGAYASTVHDSSDASQNQWRDWGWPGQLRSRVAPQWGHAGLGTSFLSSDEPAFTAGGSPVGSSTIGPMQTGYQITTGDTITIFTEACTTVDLIFWWTTGAGRFTYTVDGAASVTSAAGSVNDTFYAETISGLANTTHTIVISGPASGNSYISQWVARSRTTGFLVNRMGKSGATSDTLTYGSTTPTANQTRMWRSMFLRPNTPADLVIIMLGYNDAANQGTNGLTPTSYRANLKAATDYLSGTCGICTLLVAAPRSSNDPTPFSQQNFYDQALDLSNTDDHVAYLDTNDVFGSYALATAVGQNWGSGVDVIHPSTLGHAAIGDAIFHALFDRGLVNA